MQIFRTKSMPRNRVQHQKGLSDDAFEQLYPDEEACRTAWVSWRWPEGFKCPRCAATEYCEIRDRQLLQCRRCRYQSSLIAGTVLQGTKLPMRVWFRAMHLLAQGKKGLSNIELGRRLGISTNAAWRVQHKLMQAMIERDRRYKLGAGGPRIEIDDACMSPAPIVPPPAIRRSAGQTPCSPTSKTACSPHRAVGAKHLPRSSVPSPGASTAASTSASPSPRRQRRQCPIASSNWLRLDGKREGHYQYITLILPIRCRIPERNRFQSTRRAYSLFGTYRRLPAPSRSRG
jgi:hypothetical protein